MAADLWDAYCVLHVGSLSSRPFTSAEVEVLQVAADRAASAVQSIPCRQPTPPRR